MSTAVLPVTKTLMVKTSQERAFRVFTDGMDRWWPPEHHIGKTPMKSIVVEPREGGRWYSVHEDGSQCDIGKVLVWQPPNRLVLAWQITASWTFDPSFVTEVEVLFTAQGPKLTQVAFEHRNLERYGEAAAALREQIGAPTGWPNIMEQYARAAGMKAVVLYESAPDFRTTAPLHFPGHKARIDAFHTKGTLLAVGPFADAREGAMAIFADREAAEAFVSEDPFVLNGVVSRVTIKEWSELLLA